MFLSSLRVFASIVQDLGTNEKAKDAVYHVFDLMSSFPPALRTLHLLFEGKTPTAVEAAALAHAVFEILDEFMPTEIIGSDHSRNFEGARLLFGFILEKARTLRLGADISRDTVTLPYLSSFNTVEIRDALTGEPILHGVNTDIGLIEKALFEALQTDNVLSHSSLQSLPTKIDDDPKARRIALLSGGTTAEVTIFSTAALLNSYRYPDGGMAQSAYDSNELQELHHLAELCGRNSLTVHKPRQLASAVAPCLTFDRLGALAVYLGQQGCAGPGESTGIFRPKTGSETIDEAVVEQLIAPILERYEADGTAVFDLSGNRAVRRMQDCTEMVFFVVDVSSSMGGPTDFAEVNDDLVTPSEPEKLTADEIVEPAFYARLRLDDLKELISRHESFDDMVAIVHETQRYRQRDVAQRVVELLRLILSSDISKKHCELEGFSYRSRARTAGLQAKLDDLKCFWAALQTFCTEVSDHLIFRANTTPDIGKRWKWFIGEQLPAGSRAGHLPALPASITEVPHDHVCPISHLLMEEAAIATDKHTYSRHAIEEWFKIRRTSPMSNVVLTDLTLKPNEYVSTAVADWISGKDLLVMALPDRYNFGSQAPYITLHFNSRAGTFQRRVPTTLNFEDLYRLVFRGMRARFMVFQLTINDETILSSTETLRSKNIVDGQGVMVLAADDADMRVSTTGTSASTRTGEMCLVKVYSSSEILFSYWTERETSKTLGSIVWKYWRQRFADYLLPSISELTVWSDMSTTGDNMMRGMSRTLDENLAPLLNRNHCFGTLLEEPVYRVNDTAASSSDATPLVLKVGIYTPASETSKGKDARLSRLDVLKQMFEALINRMLAYSYRIHVGLCTFASQARIATPLTHLIENLRRSTNNMKAEGDTALWDAIALCKDQLDQYKQKFPQAKQRMIVISDGSNTNASANKPAELAWRLSQDGVALDSVLLGSEADKELSALSYALGCYSFHPTSLQNALLTCELEPFLSLSERPDVATMSSLPRNRYGFLSRYPSLVYRAMPTVVTPDSFPPRKEHPNLHDSVVQLSAASASQPMRLPASNNARSNLRTTRLMNEMRTIVANTNPKYDVYISEADMSYWKVVMEGPDDTPYAEGSFLLYIHAGDDYPTFAPDARFVTKIKHPNVNAHGRICHALLSRDWTSDTSMSTVLDTVYGLLLQAETSDPVSTAATLSYHHDQVEYADEVREHVRKHARKSRYEWKEELLT